MRVLIATVGSSGDINPFIAVGRALAARGHEVRMLVNPYFESAVVQAGLGMEPLGEEIDFRILAQLPNAVHPTRGSLVILRELVFPHVKTIYHRTDELLTSFRPDVVFSHHICTGTSWACAQRGVPWATGVLSPAMWFNPRDPARYHPWAPENPSERFSRFGLWLGKLIMRWQFDRPLNATRRELGLAPARDMVFSEAAAGNAAIGLWSAAIRGPLLGDPDNARICGFAWHDRFARFEHALPQIEEFLGECERAGEPPIVFTLGTAVVHASAPFYVQAARAAKKLGRRAILLTNRPEYAPPPAELGPGIRAFDYAPYSSLFPRAACIVHHCGVGTTAQAWRSGRPTVCVPHAYDQFDNALRAKRLGCSVTVNATRATAARLERALREVLENPAYAARAAEIGDTLRHEDGAAAAAVELERVAGKS